VTEDTRPTVALIEDDPLLRVPLAIALQAAGFDVVSAASGTEALSTLDNANVNVAVIDVRLRGHMDGMAVIREARRFHPDLKAVITSGAVAPDGAAEMGPFLPKPFRVEQLVAVINGLIGR
jgi:DNA-binding response OmpR family regulator